MRILLLSHSNKRLFDLSRQLLAAAKEEDLELDARNSEEKAEP